MSAAVRQFKQQGMNQYVPNMQFTAEVEFGGIVEVSLGTPATIAAAGLQSAIAADALTDNFSATFNGSAVAAADSPYGRTLRLTPSGDPGATGLVVDVRGEDYLGQPMIERFSVANGGTAAIEGKKAFFRVLRATVITAATNAITYGLGFSNGLGLPYKLNDMVSAVENGIITYNTLEERELTTQAAATTTAGNFDQAAPIDGFWIGWRYKITTAVTVAPDAITAFLNGVAKTDLNGTISIGAIGVSGETNLPASKWVQVAKGDTCRLTTDGASTAGAADLTWEFAYGVSTLIGPDVTDPGTRTTGDPRGIYTPQITLDGVKAIRVAFRPSRAANASNNGGLHGIKHFIA